MTANTQNFVANGAFTWGRVLAALPHVKVAYFMGQYICW